MAFRRYSTASLRSASLILVAAVLVTGVAAMIVTSHDRAGGLPTASTADWTVYHHDVGGSGRATAPINLSPASLAWESPSLDGSVFGEPLVVGAQVYVATENDTVYDLSATTGAVVWRHHLGTPVPAGSLPCGDISPTVGVTSTPVIDGARKEIFVVADEEVNGVPAHVLYGLSLARGASMVHQDVDPPGADTSAILQRASLTLDGGSVVFGYGGNAGDCGLYHGWVVSVPEAGGAMSTFEVDAGSGERHGAVWMGGGAPVVDPHGNVWVATGNGSVTTAGGPYDHSDSVLELSPGLRLEQYFAPSTWYLDNRVDADLGSSVPVVLPNGLVVQAGKSHTLYLLDGADLGGIGGQVASIGGFCGSSVDGGIAFDGNVAYLPCNGNLEKVQTDSSTRTVKVLWKTHAGAGNAPILAGGLVWTIAGASLFALNPSSGAMEQRLTILQNANHFPTPSVGDGLLLAPGNKNVFAFRGPAAR